MNQDILGTRERLDLLVSQVLMESLAVKVTKVTKEKLAKMVKEVNVARKVTKVTQVLLVHLVLMLLVQLVLMVYHWLVVVGAKQGCLNRVLDWLGRQGLDLVSLDRPVLVMDLLLGTHPVPFMEQ